MKEEFSHRALPGPCPSPQPRGFVRRQARDRGGSQGEDEETPIRMTVSPPELARVAVCYQGSGGSRRCTPAVVVMAT